MSRPPPPPPPPYPIRVAKKDYTAIIVIGVALALATALAAWNAYLDNRDVKHDLCAGQQAAAQVVADKIFAAGDSALSANVAKHETIAHEIDAAPSSDDAPMAPVLKHTFDSLYPYTTSTGSAAEDHRAGNDGANSGQGS